MGQGPQIAVRGCLRGTGIGPVLRVIAGYAPLAAGALTYLAQRHFSSRDWVKTPFLSRRLTPKRLLAAARSTLPPA